MKNAHHHHIIIICMALEKMLIIKLDRHPNLADTLDMYTHEGVAFFFDKIQSASIM